MPLCRSGGQRVKVMLLRGLLRILIDMLIVLWRSSRVKTIASNVQRSQTLLPSSEKKKDRKNMHRPHPLRSRRRRDFISNFRPLKMAQNLKSRKQ